jgi:hypothetical protein
VTPNLNDLSTEIAKLVALEKNRTERALEIGRLLNEAKPQIQHGGWLAFVRRCGLTARTAQLYMRVASLKNDDPKLSLALRDVQKMMATPRKKAITAPPTAFPTGNIASLPTGPCEACGRSCACAPESANGLDLDDEEAA